MRSVSRRSVVMGAVGLAGSMGLVGRVSAQSADVEQLYGPIEGEQFPIPGVNLNRIRPQFLRAVVDYQGGEAPGSIVIDPAAHYLYLIGQNGQAMRYGVGVGRQGFAWSGDATIRNKREWPDWYPPKEMLARDPAIMAEMSKLQSGIGMPGGPGNPLGARAMYLYQGSRDTLYRIHGTIEPWTIGSSISSGCIRMINQDVIDLYSRVPVGTSVAVLGGGGTRTRRRPEPEAQAPDQAPDQYDPTDPYGFDRRPQMPPSDDEDQSY